MALADELDPRRRARGGAGGATGYEGIGGAAALPGQLMPFLQGLRTMDVGGGPMGQGGLQALLQQLQSHPGMGRGPAESRLMNQGIDFPPGLTQGGGPGGPNIAPGNLDNAQALGQPGVAYGRAGGELPPGQAMHQQGWRNYAPGYGGAAALGFGGDPQQFAERLGLGPAPGGDAGGPPGGGRMQQQGPAGGQRPGGPGPQANPGGAGGGQAPSRIVPQGGRTGTNTNTGDPAPARTAPKRVAGARPGNEVGAGGKGVVQTGPPPHRNVAPAPPTGGKGVVQTGPPPHRTTPAPSPSTGGKGVVQSGPPPHATAGKTKPKTAPTSVGQYGGKRR